MDLGITRRDIAVLDVSGSNYLLWKVDMEHVLNSMKLEHTIQDGSVTTLAERSTAILQMSKHMDTALKFEYLMVKDPRVLWLSIHERYDNQMAVIRMNARKAWTKLAFSDFKSVSLYTTEMFRIVSEKRMCGDTVTEDEMIEKTLETFHSTNMLLQEQYRMRGFAKYSELMGCLLIAETNNELLLQNLNERNIAAESHALSIGRQSGQGRKRGRPNHGSYNNRGKFHNHGGYINRGGYTNRGGHNNRGGYNNRGGQSSRGSNHNKGGNRSRGGHGGRGRGQNVVGQKSNTWQRSEPMQNNTNIACTRCGREGHWTRTCRTSKYWVDLYRSTHGKAVETNFMGHNDQFDPTHLDVSDFIIEDPSDIVTQANA